MPSKKPKTPKPQQAQTHIITPKADPRVRLPGDGDFIGLRRAVQTQLDGISVKSQIFTVDTTGLWDIFIAALPPHLRRHYTCRSCRRFVEVSGGLVTVKDDGDLESALWSFAAAEPYTAAVDALRQAVVSRPVVGVHVVDETTWGSPTTNGWDHLAVTPHRSRVYVPTPLKSTAARLAEFREEQQMLLRGLEEFGEDVLQRAHAMLKSGSLPRPEKGLPMLEWLLAARARLVATKELRRHSNMLWLLSSSAPAGFNHVKSSMLGTLLKDISDNAPVAAIVRGWSEKTDPAQYMRAQVAPSAGNLKRAESVIAQMEAAGSLRRRYCRRDDVVETLWAPRTEQQHVTASGPVFGHIAPKQRLQPAAAVYDLPDVKMTWDKFKRTLLTDATKLEYHVPAATTQLAALVTAADYSAPPILQWDREDGATPRNPVSVYSTQAAPSQWQLQPGSFVDVDFITAMPYHWFGNAAANQKEGVLLALHGCRDAQRRQGGGFLPEFLRSELREIRASLDAYARSATVEGVETAEACGLALMKTSKVADTVRASTSPATRVYLVFDESGSMSSHHRSINAQAEVIRRQLAESMPLATVEICRFGSSVSWERGVQAQMVRSIHLGSDRGSTALYEAVFAATNKAVESGEAALIYVLTDGENNQHRISDYTCRSAVESALSTSRVTYGCVGPSSASSFFASCGIPLACVRNWDGRSSADLGAVTEQVAGGIRAYAAARAEGRSSIEDFFTAPVSGFGADGVRLRVTTSSGHRQVVVLDRWD